MTHLAIHTLRKTYPGTRKHAVRDIQLEIQSGELVALLGPSGCGKTTLLKLIAGLIHPTAGDITFDGKSVLNVPAERRGSVMVFQNGLLFPYMSIEENIGFGLKMRGIDRATIRHKVASMLDLIQLMGTEKRRPHQLSGGQQQRVALARALITDPHVLLLDEPLSNLDAHLRDEMRELILTIQRQMKVTTIFVTHDQQEAVLLADRIALLFDGILQHIAPPCDFYDRPTTVRTARFFGGVNFLPGRVCGSQFASTLGTFQLCPTHQKIDGDAILTIRPEQLQVRREFQDNSVEARVQTRLYAGTHVRYKLIAADIDFEAISLPDADCAYQEGEQVYLCLPADKLWVLPASTE